MIALVFALAGTFEHDLAERLAEVRRAAAKPEAVAPLDRLLDLEDQAPRSAWENAVEQASSIITHPLVRAQAELALAEIEDDHGDVQAAARRRAALGFLTHWWVVGPFDNEGRKGFAASYGPEQDARFRPDAEYAGKERKVGWRSADPIARRGTVLLDGMLRPDTNVVGYATSFFELQKAEDVAVRVGSAGAIKVWIDGQSVVERDVYRPLHPDQDSGGVRLGKGRHRILVKIGATEGAWAFTLRLSRPDGRPLAFRPAEPGATGGHPKKIGVADLANLLSGHARAEWLAHTTPDDPDDRTAEQAMRQGCETAECLLRLGEITQDPDSRRAALERAAGLARDPALSARVQAALGDACAQARRDRCAEADWRKALAADPSYWPPALRLAELYADRGLPAAGEAILSEWIGREPETLRVVAAYARLLERRGKRVQAEKAWQPLLAKLPGREELLRDRLSFARGRGDAAAALAVADKIFADHPEMISIQLDRAELLEGLGRPNEAEAALEAATRQVPDEPRVWERLGRFEVRRGKTEKALPALRRVLALKPQSPDVRELIARLEPKSGPDLAQTFARDVRPMASAARAQTWPGETAVVLYDAQVTRVHPNGLSTAFVQRVVEILDDRGAREQAEQAVRFTPDTQSVEVRAARVYKPSGEVWEASSRDDRDLSEPWYGIYYDVRAEVVRFDRLEPGDVIDFEYVLSDVGRRNLFADYFGDLHFFQEDLPRVESFYALLAPAGRPLYFNQPKLPGIKHTEELRGGEKYYDWRARDIPKVEAEPGMPGWSEAAAYLHVSTYKTWEDVGAWYFGLLREQLAVDQVMRDAVKKAVAGATDELAKVRAVYDLVVKSTRYVGLEFGIHGYQPYRTTQVFARKFGDCKDKASLMVALLRDLGIPADLVIVRTRRGGDIEPYPASLAIFDHAIAYVPKYDLWLDGTAEYAGSSELPAPDQGVPVLLIENGKGRLLRTPVLPAASNRVLRKQKTELRPGGAARVDEDLTLTGQAAPEWREHYQAAGDRRERYEKAWNARVPGAHVASVDMPGITDLEQPVHVKAQVELPRLGRPAGQGRWALLATGRESELVRSYARLSTRKFDLVVGYPWEQDERYEYQLPKGWKAARLPEPRKVETPFGSFEMTAEADGARVTVNAHLVVSRQRIPRAEYAGFRRFLLDVDAALNQEIVAAP